MGLTHQKIKSGLTTVSSPVTEQRHEVEQHAIHMEDQATLWGRYVRTDQNHGSVEERTQAHKDWKASVEESAEAWMDLAKVRFEDDEHWQDQLLGLEACAEDGQQGEGGRVSQAYGVDIAMNGKEEKPGL